MAKWSGKNKLGNLREDDEESSLLLARGEGSSPFGRPNPGAGVGISKIMKVLYDIEEDLKGYLEDLGTTAHNIDVLSTEVRAAMTSQEQQGAVDKMKLHMDQSKGYNAKVKACLDDLENLNGKKSTSLTKQEKDFCDTLLMEMSQLFHQRVKALLTAQGNFDTAIKGRLKKQLQTMYPEASKQDVEELLGKNQKELEQMLQKGHAETDDASLREQLQNLQGDHDAIMELEQNVIELGELFNYLSALVDKQTATLKTIEEHVNSTDHFVGEGVVKLEQAEQHQASYEWKRQCLKSICVTAIIVGVVVGGVLLYICVIKPLCIDKGR
ncbi:unnamed protein product [Amoebophrya sp. A25]|nr:unnamed protein product [Amoebophrya sp. A25]|eukprot:GSA25T00019829001.1